MGKHLIGVDPSKRLDRLKFDSRAEAREHAIHFGFYTCPHCQERVRFRSANFAHHFYSIQSNLKPADQVEFDKFRSIDYGHYGPESYLDFYCPGCKSPVRIVFEGVEFAMGAYFFVVTDVVEVHTVPVL